MSSSFPTARFPALPLSKEKAVSESLDRDLAAKGHEPSDEALIGRICSNDDEALALLFRRYSRLIWSIAERILKDRSEAEDVMQEVFLNIYRKASTFDSSKGAPRSLIIHMAYQGAFSRRTYLTSRHFPTSANRTETLERPEFPAESAVLYDESVEAHFGREGFEKALAALSEDQRETLKLFFFEGYTLEEIAQKLGQSRGNVKHHYYRGLQRLRKYVPSRTGCP